MKILHVGLLKGGVDAYFRIILSHIGCDFDFVAVRGADDGYMPYVRNGQEIKTYRTRHHLPTRYVNFWKTMRGVPGWAGMRENCLRQNSW